MSRPCAPPMMTHPVWACGRVSSVMPNAGRWLMSPIPAAVCGSRCSARFAGSGPGVPGPVPGRVVEATAYRLALVSDAARELLRTAAVARNSFSAGVVAKMLNVPVLALLGPLDKARAAGFLVKGDRPGDYRFSHALVRSAVTTGLSAAEKRRLHSAAADAIEALYEGQLDVHLAEIARHRVEASLPGDRARAVTACEAAADVAAGALAYEEAVRLYRQALSVGGEEIGEPDCSRLELAVAAALHRSGDLPGSQQTAVRVARRAERRRDRFWLARAALVMEAIGLPEWDGEICRICKQALAGDDLGGDLRARVSSRYAQALVYRGEYDRAGKVSWDALAAAGSADNPVALVDALHGRKLACSAPDGIAERAALASRMLEAADTMGSAWLEMWGRLWRIDTLFETGQLRSVQRELADLETCLDRLPGPLGRWHFLHTAATLALATGRYTEAVRLARESFTLFHDMGHPIAFGAYAAILFQAGLQIGFDRSGAVELIGQIPHHLRPDAVDTTRGVATVFPALSSAMICLHQGDRTGAGTAYAQAGPVRSWNPSAAMRMSCWATGLAVAIGLSRAEDIEFLAARFEPFRGQHVATGAGAGSYMGPVELQLGLAAAALGRLDTAADDLRRTIAICDANGARGCAVQARVELAAALTHRQAQGDPDMARAELDAAAGEAGPAAGPDGDQRGQRHPRVMPASYLDYGGMAAAPPKVRPFGGLRPIASRSTIDRLAGPRVVDDPELDEHAELVGPDPFPDDLVTVEVHDGDHPLVHRPPRRGPSRIPTRVGPAEGGPEHDRAARDYQLLDVDVQVGERLVVAADRLDPGGRTDPERIDVFLSVELGDGVVVPAIPDLLDELAHLHLAFGRVHRSPPIPENVQHRAVG